MENLTDILVITSPGFIVVYVQTIVFESVVGVKMAIAL